MIVIIAEEY